MYISISVQYGIEQKMRRKRNWGSRLPISDGQCWGSGDMFRLASVGLCGTLWGVSVGGGVPLDLGLDLNLHSQSPE
uniref:Uncharacterized protein n=1 Tax=Anguilla anguilla TaxID=7936 RepID=A0A0E9SXX4_ANGAN